MRREKIETAIIDLDHLIEDENKSEQDYQEWFEDHDVVFDSLGFSKYIPHPHFSKSTGYEEPDFIVLSPSGEWRIFEIKTPFQGIVTKDSTRPKFYAPVDKYVTQCQQYSESLDERKVREYVTDRYGISGIRKRPHSVLVVGLSTQENMDLVHTLAKRRNPPITILTYEDILDSLKRRRLFYFDSYDTSDGLSIYNVITLIKRPRSANVNHLLDVGKDQYKNRISIFANDEDYICTKVFDANGDIWNARSNDPIPSSVYNSEHLFQFEVGVNDDLGFLSIQIGWGYEIDMRLPEFPIVAPNEFVIGSDWSGQAPSWFNQKALLFLSKILPFESKYNLFSTLRHGTNQLDWETEFRGDGCLSTQNHPAQCSGTVTLDTPPA